MTCCARAHVHTLTRPPTGRPHAHAHPAQVVGSGAVPLLVGLLQPDAYGRGWGYGTPGTAGTPPQAQAYALAALQLLAMHEPRHADVICRCAAALSCLPVCVDRRRAASVARWPQAWLEGRCAAPCPSCCPA